jgi:hypothetical protein
MTDDRHDWELTGEEIARRILELSYELDELQVGQGGEEQIYANMAELGHRLAGIYLKMVNEWKELDRGD